MYSGVPHTCTEWGSGASLGECGEIGFFIVLPQVVSHLFVHKLSGILLDVTFVQVGGHAHEADLGQAKVRQLDVAKGGDEQAVGRARPLRLVARTGRSPHCTHCFSFLLRLVLMRLALSS